MQYRHGDGPLDSGAVQQSGRVAAVASVIAQRTTTLNRLGETASTNSQARAVLAARVSAYVVIGSF